MGGLLEVRKYCILFIIQLRTGEVSKSSRPIGSELTFSLHSQCFSIFSDEMGRYYHFLQIVIHDLWLLAGSIPPFTIKMIAR